MKKLLHLFVAFCLLAGSASAQLANSKDANSIKGRVLVVVPLAASGSEGKKPEDPGEARELFLKAVAGVWTFTQGEPVIMTEAEAKQLRKNNDARYVILQFDHAQEKKVNTIKTNQERERRKDRFYTVYDEFISSVLTLELPERNHPLYRIEMPVMWPREGHFVTALLELQDYLTAQLPGDNPKSQMSDIKQGGSTIRSKTLLVNENDLDKKLTAEEIKKAYPYEFRLVPYSKIEEVILQKDPGYVYLQLAPTSWANPEMVTHRIYDAATGKIVGMTMGATSKANAKHFKYYQHYIK